MADPRRSWIVLVVSVVTIVTGFTVIAGWIFNVPVLQKIIPGFESMVFNAAVCFVLFSLALLSKQYLKDQYQKTVFAVLSCAGTSVGLVTLLEFLFHFSIGIDEIFVKDKQDELLKTLYPGRM